MIIEIRKATNVLIIHNYWSRFQFLAITVLDMKFPIGCRKSNVMNVEINPVLQDGFNFENEIHMRSSACSCLKPKACFFQRFQKLHKFSNANVTKFTLQNLNRPPDPDPGRPSPSPSPLCYYLYQDSQIEIEWFELKCGP